MKDVTHLLEVVAGGQRRLTVLSDEHQAYPRAIRQLRCEVTHLVTSSKERRDARNRLFPVNLADMLLRHSSANHKRETIAWSKRRQASAERFAVFAGFTTSTSIEIKMTGFGLAVAVLLDATVIRQVLVPASMTLLGGRNWWIPRWLDRLLPDVDIEGGHVVDVREGVRT